MEDGLEEGEINSVDTDCISPMNTIHIPSNSYIPKMDSYLPEYTNRTEWVKTVERRQKRMRTRTKENVGSSPNPFYHNDTTPKSGSETISDEHPPSSSPSFSPQSFKDTSQDILWPSWLDPTGALSRSVTPLLSINKREQVKERQVTPNIGDALPPVDVTSLRPAKAVLSGDGWRRAHDGTRTASVNWHFANLLQPTDPRIPPLL